MVKKFIVTEVIRGCTIPESGRVVVVDYETGLIEKEIGFICPYSKGSKSMMLRGYRGLDYSNGRFYLANFDTILVFDKEFNLLYKFTDRIFGDIHQVRIKGDLMYIVCTWAETIVVADMYGKIIDVKDELFEEGEVSRSKDYRDMEPSDWSSHYHYNSILHHSNGSVYILAAFRKRLVNLTKKWYREYACMDMPHDLVELPDGRIAINNTNKAEIVTVNEFGEDLRILHKKHRQDRGNLGGTVGRNYGWLRGLCFDGKYLYAGTSPAIIHKIDLEGNLVKDIVLSNTEKDCIFEVRLFDL